MELLIWIIRLFWEWFKQDYRGMLDLIPEIDGLVLTFIETGAYAEKQYSNLLKTNEEKISCSSRCCC